MSERAMYIALGLEPGAPSAELKRAYRNLSLKLHPDASGDPRT
ncbi:MAG: J domain-containing protein, partial [Spirochaetes bacterium]|nr:J domain-containing protein [Spirochaetota bacterium]